MSFIPCPVIFYRRKKYKISKKTSNYHCEFPKKYAIRINIPIFYFQTNLFQGFALLFHFIKISKTKILLKSSFNAVKDLSLKLNSSSFLKFNF